METGFNESRIISIGTAVPDYSSSQDTILSFMQEEYREPDANRKLNVLFHYSGIKIRHSVIHDFIDTENRSLFPLTHELPIVSKRIDVFKQQALPLAVRAVKNSFENIKASMVCHGFT